MYRFDDRKKAEYARAAEEYRAPGRADEARGGPPLPHLPRRTDAPPGPGRPRTTPPADLDDYGPLKLHPTLLEDGTVLHDD